MEIIFIILAGVIGFALGRFSKKSFTPSSPEELEKLRESSRKALDQRTERRKEKIIEMMRDAEKRHEELRACKIETERRGVNRADVEELLGVSEQTALKYLNELEAEGRIAQIGLSGINVYYSLLK